MSAVAEVSRRREVSKALPLTLANAPAGFALIESEGHLTAFNPVFQKLLGLEARDEPVAVVTLIHPRDRSQASRLISELFSGERDSFYLDSEPATGDHRLLRWTAWRVQDESGAHNSAALLAEEMPGMAAAEQRLRQAGRLEAMGRLAGGVAHDFNNLLTGVLLYCDLLIAGLEPSHRARKYADEIRKAGLQATGLVRQLLSVARPRTSETRPISLNEIAEGMRDLLDRLTGENIELRLRLDSKLGLTRMDPTQAQQILLNLVLKRPGRDAPRRTNHDRNRQLQSTGPGPRWRRTKPRCLSAVCPFGRGRQRPRHGRVSSFTCLRAILYDQGGQGHRVGARHGLRHCGDERRIDPRRQSAGVRHAHQRVAAARARSVPKFLRRRSFAVRR